MHYADIQDFFVVAYIKIFYSQWSRTIVPITLDTFLTPNFSAACDGFLDHYQKQIQDPIFCSLGPNSPKCVMPFDYSPFFPKTLSFIRCFLLMRFISFRAFFLMWVISISAFSLCALCHSVHFPNALYLIPMRLLSFNTFSQ